MRRLRTKVLAVGLGCVALSAASIGGLGTFFLRRQLEYELRLRSVTATRTFLKVAAGALRAGRLDAAKDYLDSLMAEPDLEEACLLDPSGRPLACKRREESGAPGSIDAATLARALRSFTPQFEARDGGGGRGLEVYQRVWSEEPAVATLGACYLRFSSYRIDRQIRSDLLAFAAAGALGAAVIALLAILLAVGITRPLERLREGFAALEAGALPVSLGVRSKDELGELARGFEAMARRMQAAREDLLESRAMYKTMAEAQTERAAQLAKALEELKALRERLTHSERLSIMGQVVAGVAHELNNPLSGILGYGQLLLGRDAVQRDAGLRGDLETVVHEAERCRKIVQSLSTFSRQRKAERRPVSINEIIEQSLTLEAYQLKTRNIAVAKALDPELPPTMADAAQLQQVLLNLFVNAQHAMSGTSGRGTLTVRSKRADGRIRIEVEDDGPGIPERNLSRVFEPFFTTKEVGKGTGLGLSISYGIIEEHQGRIWAESRPGKGALFVVELPVVEAVPATAPEPPAGAPAPRGRRVLVVDDEKVVRDVLSSVLREMGQKVDLAADGRAAQDKLAAADYDLVLCDLRMPELDGLALYSWTRRERPGLARRWVFITGSVTPETERALAELDAPSLTKPFDVPELKATLSRLLSSDPKL